MSEQQQPVIKKLTVISSVFARSGSTNGRDWAIYDLEVADENGHAIAEKFSAFDDLTDDVGKLLEFFVDVRDHEQYGRSYTIKKKGGGLGKAVDALRDRIVKLEAKVFGAKSDIPVDTADLVPVNAGPATSDNLDEIPF